MNVLMFLRILTVYPLLVFIVRVQNSLMFFGQDWPGYTAIAIKNTVIIAAGCLSAIFYDHVSTTKIYSLKNQIGDIIRYTGTFCAAILMYLLPCAIQLIDDKKETGHYRPLIWTFHILLILYGVANFVIQFTVDVY